jgi:hypothetical protein
MINKYNFSKSQTNSNMYKSYILTIKFSRKKVIKQANTQTNYIHYTKMHVADYNFNIIDEFPYRN